MAEAVCPAIIGSILNAVRGFQNVMPVGKMVLSGYLPQIFEESRMFWKRKKQEKTDGATPEEKEKARRKRYEQSDKAKARRLRYLEKNQSEITRKRKEKEELERQGRLVAFSNHFNLDVGEMRRYMELKENGVDIWARSVHYAKFIDIFQTGKYPQEMRISMVATRRMVPGTDQFSVPSPRRNRSVGSIDYW